MNELQNELATFEAVGKRASDFLKSRGYWNAVTGSLLSMIVAAFVVWLDQTYNIQIPVELVVVVIVNIAALFGINIRGYKMQDYATAQHGISDVVEVKR